MCICARDILHLQWECARDILHLQWDRKLSNFCQVGWFQFQMTYIVVHFPAESSQNSHVPKSSILQRYQNIVPVQEFSAYISRALVDSSTHMTKSIIEINYQKNK